MRLAERLRSMHRFWRYRLRTERSSVAFLLQQPLADALVLDIGANRGIYSYWMSKAVGPGGRVIAFEPQPELAAYLREVRSTFGLANLEIVNIGLSSAAGERMLFRPEAGSGGASLEAGVPANWGAIEVEVTTLDAFYDDRRPVRFIKCDVEGHEYDVLRGGQRLLARDHPTLLLEIRDSEAAKGDISNFLGALGYEGFFFHKSERIEFARFNDFPHRKDWELHRNYVFLPAAALTSN